MTTLKEIIEHIGTRRTAAVCAVTPGVVVWWKANGLPTRKGLTQGRRVHYEKCIARELGWPTAKLRELLAEEDRQRAA